MRSALAITAVLGIALAGCTTTSPQERRAADERECRGYGFRAGTAPFAECLQRFELDRRAERRARTWDDGLYGRYGRF